MKLNILLIEIFINILYDHIEKVLKKMNSSRNFRFHRFSDFPLNNTQSSFEKSKYFLKTMKDNIVPNDTFNNKEEKKENNQNHNLTTYRFNNYNKYKNDFIFNNVFPIKEIINTDFEKNAIIKNFSLFKDLFPQMAYQNLDENSNLILKKNPNLTLLLKQFQYLLQYLSNTEKNLNKYNDILNLSEKDIYSDKRKLIEKELKINKKLEENANKIMELENKINIYKKFILNANIEFQNKNLEFKALDIHDDENNYYCDLCADRIFSSYEEVQRHYEKEHENIIKLREKNYRNLNYIKVNNPDYEKYYFETKFNNAKNEINFLLHELNDEKKYNDDKNENKMNESDKNYSNLKYKSKNMKNLTNKNLNINNFGEENDYFNESENDMEYFENKLNKYEKMQKLYNDNLQKSFDSFKKEILTQLRHLRNQQPIIKENKQTNINNNIIDDSIKKDLHNENNQEKIELGEKYYNSSLLNSLGEVNFKLNNINKNFFNDNKFNNKDYSKKNIKENLKESNNKVDDEKEEKKINLKNKINNNNLAINEFSINYFEREKNILFNKTENKFITNDYNILENQINKDITEKTDIKIKKINTKYHLENEKTIDQYKEIIKDIYNKNENLTRKTGQNYFDNILEKIDIKKFLDSIIE